MLMKRSQIVTLFINLEVPAFLTHLLDSMAGHGGSIPFVHLLKVSPSILSNASNSCLYSTFFLVLSVSVKMANSTIQDLVQNNAIQYCIYCPETKLQSTRRYVDAWTFKVSGRGPGLLLADVRAHP